MKFIGFDFIEDSIVIWCIHLILFLQKMDVNKNEIDINGNENKKEEMIILPGT